MRNGIEFVFNNQTVLIQLFFVKTVCLDLSLNGDLRLSSSSSSSLSSSSSSSSKKLGIDVGSFLAPLLEKEVAELRVAANEVVNDAVVAGIDEIETIKSKMQLEVDE